MPVADFQGKKKKSFHTLQEEKHMSEFTEMGE